MGVREALKDFGKIFLGSLLLSGMPLLGQTNSRPPQPQTHGHAQSKRVPPAHGDRGQQVFEQNCSRCHNAPTGFSPSISGTIAMHMRVRAGLSEEDYKELRRFLNP
jgi:cytochrome c5